MRRREAGVSVARLECQSRGWSVSREAGVSVARLECQWPADLHQLTTQSTHDSGIIYSQAPAIVCFDLRPTTATKTTFSSSSPLRGHSHQLWRTHPTVASSTPSHSSYRLLWPPPPPPQRRTIAINRSDEQSPSTAFLFLLLVVERTPPSALAHPPSQWHRLLPVTPVIVCFALPQLTTRSTHDQSPQSSSALTCDAGPTTDENRFLFLLVERAPPSALAHPPSQWHRLLTPSHPSHRLP